MKDLTVIILTYNEEIHLSRVLRNVLALTKNIIIVDSFSNDKTQQICLAFGVRFYQNKFINQAQQLNWAIDNLGIESEWLLRLDADELLSENLIREIQDELPNMPPNVSGVFLNRKVFFLGKWIRFGGYYPSWILRIWRNGKGRSESKWMDEYIIVDGDTIQLKNHFSDINLNNITWWIEKHNNYATREAIEILNKRYEFINLPEEENFGFSKRSLVKRKYKDNLYLKLPLFLRSAVYFGFRFFLKLGFLDGTIGLIWHFLQGFWYRFLVDAKIYQIECRAKAKNKTVKQILNEDFGFNFD